MSNRDSMGFGDLIPQDVVDIFAQEKHGKRGQKKRSHSLGRALVWLKGKKRKDLDAKGQVLGLGPALDLALDGHPAGHQGGHKGGQKSGRQAHPQGNGHAVPKRHDNDKTPAPPLFQENVFIEGSRPQYLENLHTEALEGLKMMQQEESNNGVEFQDNESTISTMTVHTDGEGGGFTTDSTIADSSSVVSVQSSVSTRSSRSGLTRQESTFRPLNSGKKSETTKTRRRHRKTVAGIPRHVQKELGLDRAAWTQRLDEEHLHNGESDDKPTSSDAPQQAAEPQTGAASSLQSTNAVPQLSKDQLHQLVGTSDDLDLLHRLEPDLSAEQRPRSLAVPWMTTANSLQPEPPSPVMSMSPQAAYMSKIIPNAVLPPSIDVVEISRGRSRNSVRTVSKSSLLVSSPSPSRASSRASNITSASRYNPINVSDNSCWSNSESSETLVSDSSTISRSSTPRQRKLQDGDTSAKEDKVSVHSSNSKACTSNGKVVVKVGGVKKDGFARSLSVMKAKRAPPPPSRSYSLHNKMKRRSRDLAEVKVPGEENEKNTRGTLDSPGYNADTSSLDESMSSASFSPIRAQQQAAKAEDAAKSEEEEKKKPVQESKRSRVVSPSSGYSSQDGASAKGSKPSHKRGIFAKFQRLFPGSTHAPSSASAAQQPEKVMTDTSVDTVSPSVRALRELFNIPPPPKVRAPPPPPPEVWAHSKRSFELLLGPPAPDNLQAIIKRNPKDRRQQRQSPSVSTESSVKSLVMERKHGSMAVANGSLRETSKVQESVIAESSREKSDRLAENVDLKGNSQVEKVRVSNLISEMLVRAAEKHEGRLEAVREEDQAKTLPAISLIRMPPSPSPPLVHHPPQQTAVSPESSWPPPPPPMAQVSLNGPDEVDLPLPPPPAFVDLGIVVPFQAGGDSSGSTGSVVKREAEPQTPSAPLNIPPPPPYKAPPPPVKTVSPPAIVVVSPPPPTEIPPPPSKEFSPPPPTEIPPPPSKEFSPPPPKEIPPPPSKEFSPPPPTEIPPPPSKEAFPPPPTEIPPTPPLLHLKQICPVRPKDSSPPLVTMVSPSPVKEVSPPLVTVVSPSPVKEVSPPLVMEVSTLSAEEVSVGACPSSEEVTPVSSLVPPQSIPPPPPLPSQQVDAPLENIPEPQKTVPANQDTSSSSDASVSPALEKSPEKAQDAAPSPPPPPPPVQGLANVKPQPSPAGVERQTVELTSTPDVQEELAPIVTPSLLQMVKLRSVNSSPEPPKDQEPPEAEVTAMKQPSDVVPTSSASSEAPQKPIRRSLIIISPTSPPAEPALPNSQSVSVLPPSSPPAVSPTRKSPPAMTASPSMNLQEAIRLRTAARSKAGPPSRLAVHPPTSPMDIHKSPSSTASFIFAKSNKRVVIETKPALETKTKAAGEAESVKKVPPPVARKPKTKNKEIESSEETEALHESVTGAVEKTNGTAGTVEGETPST